MLERVEILRINSPNDFWICQKNSEQFLRLMHEEILNEVQNEGESYRRKGACGQASSQSIIGVFKKSIRRWFRARLLSHKTVRNDGEEEYVKCYLVDIGEDLIVPRYSTCSLVNPKLQEIAPLAINCSLYGIKSKFA